MMYYFSVKFVSKIYAHFMEDKKAAICFLVVNLFQFHLNFYATRPLPNVYALVLCNYAIGFWLWKEWPTAVKALAIASVVLRCDTVVFAFPLIVFDMLNGTLTKDS